MNSPQQSDPTRAWPIPLILAMLVATVGVLAHALLGQSWRTSSGHAVGSDDAYISFRYAENLFNGLGLVWNQGERVEGYSNFLYTVLLSPLFAFGKHHVYMGSVVLNAILLLGCIVVFWRFCRSRLAYAEALVCVVLLATNPWVWVHAASGLETTLILLAVTAFWVALEQAQDAPNRHNLGVLAALTVLSVISRVDGFILPFGAIVFLLLKRNFRIAGVVGATLLGSAVIYTVAREIYYQDVIANTYYAKVSGNLLVRLKVGLKFYLRYMAAVGAWLGLLLAAGRLLRARSVANVVARIDFPLFFMGMWSAYVIYVGGDLYYERFLVALIPMGLYLAIARGPSRRVIRYLLVTFACVLLPWTFAARDERLQYAYPKYDAWITAGEFLRDNYRGETLACDACGKIPFYAELPTLDMLGLNDRHIGKMKAPPSNDFFPGHTKFDAVYVLSRKPTLIAVWTTPTLDMAFGLNRDLYEKDYVLKYLVNSRRADRGRNIVDVQGMPEPRVKELVDDGFDYAILLRKDRATRAPDVLN